MTDVIEQAVDFLLEWKYEEDDACFFLIGNRLHVFSGLHMYWLRDKFGLGIDEADMVRHAMPRGRAMRGVYAVTIEMSPEMESWKKEITTQLGLTLSDRPRFVTKERHYNVVDPATMAEDLYYNSGISDRPRFVTIDLSQGGPLIRFLKQYLPEVLVNLEKMQEAA